MTARQEKVREALEFANAMLTGETAFAAALAEVEEWEQGMAHRMEVGRDMADRLETCWAERKAAEAEADRLREALEDLRDHAFSGEDRRFARRALAPADRNTT